MTGIERGAWGMRTGFLSGQALSPCLNPCCDPEASQQAYKVRISIPILTYEETEAQNGKANFSGSNS